MGLLSGLFTAGVGDAVGAVGTAMDKLFTSDEERAAGAAVMEKLRQQPGVLQAEINKIEASHKSWFVAGWRPAIGWVCSMGLAFAYVINPCIQWWSGTPGPELPMESIDAMVYALLGLGAMRTAEKFGGRTK